MANGVVAMSGQKQTAPAEELRRQFMDHSTPLNEAGHWARRRIEQLEAEKERLREALEGAWSDGYCFCGPEGYTDQQKAVQAALTTTESK